MNILVVEDETAIAAGLKFNFEQEGYPTFLAIDGNSALQLLTGNRKFDLVVLDLMLPGMSGYEICKEIRRLDKRLPIMVLSARLTSQDKAHAFDCGADQYVTKPFDLQEVLSRVRNLLQLRADANQPPPVEGNAPLVSFGQVTVDRAGFEVQVAGEPHSLTTMEMQLLDYFLQHPGVVLSRTQLLAEVWGHDAHVTSRTIDNFVMRLRRLIEPQPSKPVHLLSVRGTGYRFLPGEAKDPEKTTE